MPEFPSVFLAEVDFCAVEIGIGSGHDPEPGGFLCRIGDQRTPWNITVIIHRILDYGAAHLPQIRGALRASRFYAGAVQRGKQKAGQDGDDHYSIDIKLMSIGKYATYI